MGNKHKEKAAVEIPAVAFRHITIECGKVSRRFHLNEDEQAELESHIRCEALCAVDKKYDEEKGTVYTFIQRVVRNRICAWMKEETERRNDWRAHIEAEARRQANGAGGGRGAGGDSVDDTTYSEEERWDCGEQLPEKLPNEEKEWDPVGLMRMMVMANVRQVVGSLKGDSKRICKWYLRTGSLRKTMAKMHVDSKHFFNELWPSCKAEFIAKWNALGKHFEGQI